MHFIDHPGNWILLKYNDKPWVRFLLLDKFWETVIKLVHEDWLLYSKSTINYGDFSFKTKAKIIVSCVVFLHTITYEKAI